MRAGQALERNPLGCELEPPLEERVVGEQRLELAVDPGDVGRIPGERGPAERPDPPAEQRPDIGRDESRVCESVAQARPIGLTSQVVAIVENVASHPDELDHRPDVRHDRLGRQPQVLLRIPLAQPARLLERDLRRDVTRQRIVCGGLVRDQVERLAARDELRQDVGRIRTQRDRERPSFCGRGAHAIRAHRRGSRPARPGSASRDDGRSSAGRRRRRGSRRPPSWRRAAGLRPCRRGRRSTRCVPRDRVTRNAPRPRRRTSGRCPGGFPACRCRSTIRRSSARTSSGPRPRAA